MTTTTRPPRAQVAPTVALALVLIALAWSWLLLPALGSVGEMIAIGAPLLAVGVLAVHIVALVAQKRASPGRRVVLVSLVAWMVSGTVMIVSPRTPVDYAPPRDPVIVVAANLHSSNFTPRAAARDVVARDADVIVISESTRASESVMSEAFPFTTRSEYRGIYGYAQLVASRYPLRSQPVPAELEQTVVVEVMAPNPFLLIGVHLPRAGINVPSLRGRVSFDGQREAIAAVTRLSDASSLPVVVAGDLNVSDRTAAYRRLVSGRHDAMRAGWARSTYRPFPWNLLGLRIDHVLIDASWCAEHARRFRPGGSDHDAAQAAIGPCP